LEKITTGFMSILYRIPAQYAPAVIDSILLLLKERKTVTDEHEVLLIKKQ
jgi:hypothetical protein